MVTIRDFWREVPLSSAFFPAPRDYAGEPVPSEGLRQALALATEAELNTTMAMLVMGAKAAAGLRDDEQVTAPLQGTAALLGWMSALVMSEKERRLLLFDDLGGASGEA